MTAAQRIRIPHNWTPRAYQIPFWQYFQRGGKRAVEIAHRRWGKDDVAMHLTCRMAFQRPATYWHMLPKASQARKAIWKAVNPHTGKRRIDEAFPEVVRKSTNDTEMLITLRNGATWQVLGSDNFDSLVGSPPAGVILSEYALSNPYAWAYIKPILDENDGWAAFITTPRGNNHAKKLYDSACGNPDWFAQRSSVMDTGRFPLEKLEEFRREYIELFGEDAGNALYEQEYLVSFDAAILGSYYGREMAIADKEGRIGLVPHEPSLPVFTAWDLGFSDDTGIWFFQVLWGEVRAIDYYKANGKDVKHYAEVIHGREILVDEWGEHGKPKRWHFGAPLADHKHRITYKYGKHWGPHDARPKTLAANGRSIVQQLFDYKVKMGIAPNLGIEDGIQAVRALLPRCHFDRQRCEFGIESLRNYRREYDEDKKMFLDSPLHDWTSHGSDAFRMLALVWRTPEANKAAEKPRFLQDMTANEVFWPEKNHLTPARERI